jgi:hypothetical protein
MDGPGVALTEVSKVAVGADDAQAVRGRQHEAGRVILPGVGEALRRRA